MKPHSLRSICFLKGIKFRVYYYLLKGLSKVVENIFVFYFPSSTCTAPTPDPSAAEMPSAQLASWATELGAGGVMLIIIA